MTALYGKRDASLAGIEEPENYIHPTALQSFVEYALDSGNDAQLVITTHSPLLLDFLDDPSAVRVVRRNERDGTIVQQVGDPDKIREALEASGFGLGEFYQRLYLKPSRGQSPRHYVNHRYPNPSLRSLGRLFAVLASAGGSCPAGRTSSQLPIASEEP